jgi:hypothetical protein
MILILRLILMLIQSQKRPTQLKKRVVLQSLTTVFQKSPCSVCLGWALGQRNITVPHFFCLTLEILLLSKLAAEWLHLV